MKRFWVYIISNKSRRLYTGLADDLALRVFEHKHKLFPDSFTAQYNYDTLVYFEPFPRWFPGRMRELQIKSWRREKKIRLIESINPDWADLSAGWQEDPSWAAIPEAEWRLKPRKKPL